MKQDDKETKRMSDKGAANDPVLEYEEIETGKMLNGEPLVTLRYRVRVDPKRFRSGS